MAEKRMFAKVLIDSDLFLDMPLSTQALYFHLSMRADDDGFVNNPKKIARMIGASDDDNKILIAKGFIMAFESGVIVVRHWKVHNSIKKDRYKPTLCINEKAEITETANNEYAFIHDCDIEWRQIGAKMEPKRSQHGTSLEPVWNQFGTTDKTSIDKISIDKNSIDKNNMVSQQADVTECLPDKRKSLSNRFEELWTLYPRKEGKKAAQTAYERAVKHGTTDEDIKSGIEQYNAHISLNKIESRYIKKGDTYFRNECWNDVYEEKRQQVVSNVSSYDDDEFDYLACTLSKNTKRKE